MLWGNPEGVGQPVAPGRGGVGERHVELGKTVLEEDTPAASESRSRVGEGDSVLPAEEAVMAKREGDH